MRKALKRIAGDVAEPGRIDAKTVKSIRGTHDSFQRLRVGDQRVMYDIMPSDGVLLVLGIVQRGDLERWLRRR